MHPYVTLVHRTPINFHDLVRSFLEQVRELLFCGYAEIVQLFQLLDILTCKIIVLCRKEPLKNFVDYFWG